ncbi:Probable E3 ubiquitin-protein ligase RHY1A [Linum perenne]
MAGMLPGVECARRRRFHKSGGIRRPSFCLYTSNHEGSNTSVTSLRSIQSDIHEDEKLGGVVREAKERLNWRLRAQNKSYNTDQCREKGNQGKLRIVDGSTIEALGELGGGGAAKSSSSSSKKWVVGKLRMMAARWKGSSEEDDECTICLDGFKSRDNFLHLPCAHRFHSKCLLPWLLSNSHCPCCRFQIRIQLPC